MTDDRTPEQHYIPKTIEVRHGDGRYTRTVLMFDTREGYLVHIYLPIDIEKELKAELSRGVLA